MKTYNNLYERIYSFDNLHQAYLKARKNKRYKNDVLEFTSNLEENLITIQNELIYEAYTPSRYNEFLVTDPKERLILALPFRDRVVHQAICSVIEPLFEKTFIKDSYACRKNKGTLAGVKRMEYFLKQNIKDSKEVFCLKMDIQKYFYSIDHETVKRFLRRKIRCKRTLKLLNIIIDSTDNPGIPVGNLTSQLFANIYMNYLDHFIKETLRIKYYVRYMDDMVILYKDKKQLWRWLSEIRNFIEKELKLVLNKKTSIFSIKRGIDFLGYRQFPGVRILRKRVMVKNLKKFRKFNKAGASPDKVNKSLASLQGLCKHCSSGKFMGKIGSIISNG
jgi:retron-type reverse transcriptase